MVRQLTMANIIATSIREDPLPAGMGNTLLVNRGTAAILVGKQRGGVGYNGLTINPGDSVIVDLTDQYWVKSASGSQPLDILPGGVAVSLAGTSQGTFLNSQIALNVAGSAQPAITVDTSLFTEVSIRIRFYSGSVTQAAPAYLPISFVWAGGSDQFENKRDIFAETIEI